MTEIELKALETEIKLELKKQTDAMALFTKASTDQKAELDGQIKAADVKIGKLETERDLLSKQMDKIQLEMKDSKLFGPKGEDSIQLMKANWDKKEFRDELKERNSRKSHTFEIKAIMDTATNLSGSALATAVVLPEREAGIGKAPDRIPTFLDLISRGVTGSDTLTWVERSARTASAAAVAEGAAYAQSDLTYIQRSIGVERIGHYFKVQNRSLDDWDALLSEIMDEGVTGLERILEQYCYSGTGTTPQIQGITDTGFAAAYSSTGLQGKIVSPNHFDAIRACIMQLRQGEYVSNLKGFINPADGAAMDMPKSADGIYLLPPFTAPNGMVVKGVPIYESNLVTAGELLIGEMSRIKLFMRKGIEVKIFEQNENDALYDRKTITVSCRAANRIKTPDYAAFVYDQFDDIISDLTKI